MSRPQQYTDDLRLAHILADSVDRVSAMRFRDRPVFSPASEVVEPAEAAPAAAPLAPWQRYVPPPSGTTRIWTPSANLLAARMSSLLTMSMCPLNFCALS